jgi:tRNA pseudouridine55 synthase
VLDPFAHGLLIILCGAGTRLFERLHEVPKRYLAEVQWGTETDTGDAGGQVSASSSVVPGLAALEAGLATFKGWSNQVPPATSNKRVDGERAYEKAHRGERVVLPPSKVFLHEASARAHERADRTWLEVSVRGGFYLRSLVRDLARSLGAAAHLVTLERTQIGPWKTPRGGPERLTGREVLPWLPSRELSDAEWGQLKREGVLGTGATTLPAWPLPKGFPGVDQVRFFHLERLVAVQSKAFTTLLPGGI